VIISYPILSKFLKKYSSIFLLILICGGVTLILIDKIDLPGPYQDDTNLLPVAHRMIEDELNYCRNCITIFEKNFPLGSHYNGLISFYLFKLPMVYFFGLDYIFVRYYGILFVLLTTIFTYLFSKELFNPKIGIIAAALFAFLPSTILFAKYPMWASYTLPFFSIATLYFLIKWKNSTKKRYLIMSFLFIGLGIGDKLNFLWLIIGLVITYFIFHPKFKKDLTTLLLGLSSLFAGSFLFVLSYLNNLQSQVGALLANLTVTYYGQSNLNIFDNLIIRFEHLDQLITGDFFHMFGGSHSNFILFPLFIISLFGIIITKKVDYRNYFRKYLFIILLVFFMLASSIFTPTVLNTAQLIILLPFLSIIIAVFIFMFGKSIEKYSKIKNLHLPILVIFSILVITSNILVVNEYKNDMVKTGGIGLFSNKIVDLTDFLLTNNYTKITTLDWGFDAPLYVLSGGNITITTNILYNQEDFQVNRYKNILERSFEFPEVIYVKNVRDAPISGSSDLFPDTLKEHGKTPILIKTFYSWDEKTPLYFVYRVQ